MKLQKNYKTFLTEELQNTATWEVEIKLWVASDSETGYLIIEPWVNSQEESIFFHRKLGTSVFCYWVNRDNPIFHTINSQVFLASSIDLFNHYSNFIWEQWHIFKLSTSDVIIKGWTYYLDDVNVVINDVDTSLALTNKTLVPNAINYVHIKDWDYYISITEDASYLLATITVNAGGLVTSIDKKNIYWIGTKGTTWSSIISWDLVWDDLIFTKDDATTVAIVDAKIEFQEWNTAWNTVGNTVGNTIWNTVWNTLNNTLNNTAGNTAGNTVGNTVWNTLNNTDWNTVWNTVGNTIWNTVGTVQWQWPWVAWTYQINEWVYYNGSSYVANTITTNTPPHADWDLMAAKWADWLWFWDFLADGTVPMTWDLNLNGNDIIGLNLDGVNDVATTTETTADILIKDGANWVNTDVMTQDQLTGFADNTNITVTYSHTNRTTTLTHPSGTITYYYRWVKKTLTSPWISVPHVDVTANYFLYSTDWTNFTWSTTPWNFRDLMTAYVRFVSWSTAASFALREVHWLLDTKAHQILHSQIWTHRVSGWILTSWTYTENTATNAATTPWFDSAVIRDEDIDTTIPALIEWSYTQMYIGATNTVTFMKGWLYPFLETWSFLKVNNATTWALTDWINNRWYNIYQILVPATADAESQSFRTILLQPQATHTSLGNALIEDPRSLNLWNFANLATEWVIYSRITYVTSNGDTNAGKCRIATWWVSYIVWNRMWQSPVSGFNPTDHTVLDNLEWNLSWHTDWIDSVATFGASWEATTKLLSEFVQTSWAQTVGWVKNFFSNIWINTSTPWYWAHVNRKYLSIKWLTDCWVLQLVHWTATQADWTLLWIVEFINWAWNRSWYIASFARWTWLESDLIFNVSNVVKMTLNKDWALGLWTISNASALLDINSTTRWFLPPRMTTTQRNAIATPAKWLVIYNTTDNVLNTYNWTTWWAIGGWGSNPIFRTWIQGQIYTWIIDRFLAKWIQTIAWVKISLSSLPTWANVSVDIRKNWTAVANSIFTSDTAISITTAQGATNWIYITTWTSIDNWSLVENDVIYVVVTLVWSTLPGSDLEVVIY